MFDYFYNEALRKLVLGFGNLFNNIYVGKYNSAGTLLDKNRVPLTYSPKAKFIRRILMEHQFLIMQKFHIWLILDYMLLVEALMKIYKW